MAAEMILTRRQLVALLLGAAAGPAIAAAAPRPLERGDIILTGPAIILKVGDILTFGASGDRLNHWKVVEVYAPGGHDIARLEPHNWEPPFDELKFWAPYNRDEAAPRRIKRMES